MISSRDGRVIVNIFMVAFGVFLLSGSTLTGMPIKSIEQNYENLYGSGAKFFREMCCVLGATDPTGRVLVDYRIHDDTIGPGMDTQTYCQNILKKDKDYSVLISSHIGACTYCGNDIVDVPNDVYQDRTEHIIVGSFNEQCDGNKVQLSRNSCPLGLVPLCRSCIVECVRPITAFFSRLF